MFYGVTAPVSYQSRLTVRRTVLPVEKFNTYYTYNKQTIKLKKRDLASYRHGLPPNPITGYKDVNESHEFILYTIISNAIICVQTGDKQIIK